MRHKRYKQGARASMAIVMFERTLVSSAGAFIDVAQTARRYVKEQYGAVDSLDEQSFEVVGVTMLGAADLSVGLLNRKVWPVDDVVGGTQLYDIVFLAAFDMTQTETIDLPQVADRRLLEWLQRQHAEGAAVGASGGSVLALAEAGLLDRRRAAIPWWLQRHVRERFPLIQIDEINAVTDDANLFCSSGIATDQALALNMIDRVISSNLARYLARILSVDCAPLASGVWSATRADRDRDDLVSRAQHWLQQRYSRQIRINDLAAEMLVSRRTLGRRFEIELGMTPIEYLHDLRLNAAKLLLARSRMSAARISVLVGYTDIGYFRKLFERDVGMSPSNYRRQCLADDQLGLTST